MIYLDANIFAYAAMNNEKKGYNSRELLNRIIDGKEKGFTCTLTWDEVVHAIWKKEGREKAVMEGKKMLELDSINWIKITKEVINTAQEIMEKTSLKPRDAIHAAAAISNNIIQFATDDSDFNKIKELKIVKI
jgi:predicted nucleic acid-binding protein